MRNSGESHEKAKRKSWKSQEKVMKKSWVIHKNVMKKSSECHDILMTKSWESHDKYSTSTADLCRHVCSCLFSRNLSEVRGHRKKQEAPWPLTMALPFRQKAMVKISKFYFTPIILQMCSQLRQILDFQQNNIWLKTKGPNPEYFTAN